ICPECERSFNSESALKQHSHMHTSQKPFICPTCSRAYTQQTSLSRHIRFN
ncbi:hypothetical protein HELRODRAFT_153802, partial [Helobdella robusta]|uniref:C2H2-type domain-containing protein n=1 Tax=Helobdella robusta TaxID=6412 RepID=T1ELB9_HELRO